MGSLLGRSAGRVARFLLHRVVGKVIGYPVGRRLMFALTSGTTAGRKYIPVTPRYLRDYKRGWNLWGLRAWRDHQDIKWRPIVQLSSDPDEFRTEAGIPCGAVTGLTARMQKRIIRWMYCVPAGVGRVKDATPKHYL